MQRLHAITLSPYRQRRCAGARAIPKRQQISFHACKSPVPQTSSPKVSRCEVHLTALSLVERPLCPVCAENDFLPSIDVKCQLRTCRRTRNLEAEAAVTDAQIAYARTITAAYEKRTGATVH